MNSRIDLAYYFNELGFKTGAEIGVAAGSFSETLCKAIPGVKLYCIDPWDTYKGNQRGGGKEMQYRNYEVAKERLSKYDATLIREKSMDAVKKFDYFSLDFVFIDGNHNFDFVIQDIIEWSYRIRSGGIVSGHDYYNFNNSGVIEAVDAYVNAHRLQLNLTSKEIRKKQLDDEQPSWWFIKK